MEISETVKYTMTIYCSSTYLENKSNQYDTGTLYICNIIDWTRGHFELKQLWNKSLYNILRHLANVIYNI